jgi:hypothetical protein
VIVRADIDDIEFTSWQGMIEQLPAIPSFAPDPVIAELLLGDHAGWRAEAYLDIGSDATARLRGLEPFKPAV